MAVKLELSRRGKPVRDTVVTKFERVIVPVYRGIYIEVSGKPARAEEAPDGREISGSVTALDKNGAKIQAKDNAGFYISPTGAPLEPGQVLVFSPKRGETIAIQLLELPVHLPNPSGGLWKIERGQRLTITALPLRP